MTIKDRYPGCADDLRHRADEQISKSTGRAKDDGTEPTGVDRLVHELKVHQIELEMQNEELRRTQHDLEESRARYFDLYDLAPVGYLTFNKTGLIMEANLTAATMLGVARNVLLQRVLSQYVCTEDQDLYYLYRKQIVESGELQDWDMRMLRADGSQFWAHLRAVQANDGEYRIAFNDITDHKNAETERLELERQLQQSRKLESIGVLAGGIAHDFNNILAVIVCYCALIEQKPEQAGELVSEIEKAAERAAELCRQMLAYAGKTQLVPTLVKLPALVDEMLRMLKATINPNAAIKSDISADLPSIRADASQIRQIIMNLIINAAEAIGEAQGEIRIALTECEIGFGRSEKDHLGKVIPPGQYVCLEVTDNGCGMDAETRQRIFEPFYSTKFSGRGMGMSAVLGIITSHGGALQFESQPGRGSTFKVYLPVPESESAAEPLHVAAFIPWQGSGTILLAEDEPQLMMVAKMLLKALGFDVFEAINGKEALELYRKHAAYITLVITDMGMPVMDGYELISELKKLDPQLPIIISSGYGDTAITSRFAEEDIAGFLSKPYGFDQLRAVLRSVVEKKTP